MKLPAIVLIPVFFLGAIAGLTTARFVFPDDSAAVAQLKIMQEKQAAEAAAKERDRKITDGFAKSLKN
ncbi:hypothetical protein [Microvirga puerhi]|uniref:Uncharacterized protein n=1 Tax=Microvirga puerhi TaxID=2876078 RepID=A0ABS7VTJ0_9HYPH|nr:hypothetical protein [Microvirga puerhi]MBZ6078887.1 hypothetical protein [Microvirga puerhi]